MDFLIDTNILSQQNVDILRVSDCGFVDARNPSSDRVTSDDGIGNRLMGASSFDPYDLNGKNRKACFVCS